MSCRIRPDSSCQNNFLQSRAPDHFLVNKILFVKQIPVRSWSSPTPFSIRPRPATFLLLCVGLVLFGLGESLLIASGAGVSPWTVLAQGIAGRVGWSIGFTTMIISVGVLLLWIPLRQKPGMGTILNALIIALMIDFSLTWLPYPRSVIWQLVQSATGVLVVGLASGIYLTANLGAGPRDGLMTGLQQLTGFPIATIRIALEVMVVTTGWYLGGVVGFGTLLFAFGVGPCVALGILFVRRFL